MSSAEKRARKWLDSQNRGYGESFAPDPREFVPELLAKIEGLTNRLQAAQAAAQAVPQIDRETLADRLDAAIADWDLRIVDKQPTRPLANELVDAVIPHLQAQPVEGEVEWEYAWEADEARRSQMVPRGPKVMMDGWIDTPEAIARFPKGRRVRRRPAGPWIEVQS